MQVHVAGLHSHWEPQHRLCEGVSAVWLVVNHRRDNVTGDCDWTDGWFMHVAWKEAVQVLSEDMVGSVSRYSVPNRSVTNVISCFSLFQHHMVLMSCCQGCIKWLLDSGGCKPQEGDTWGEDTESGPVGTLNGDCERICHSGRKLRHEEMANLRLWNSGNSGGT